MRRLRLLPLLIGLVACAGADRQTGTAALLAAAAAGEITYLLSSPDDVGRLLGPALGQSERIDGGSTLLTVQYSGAEALFRRRGDDTAPVGLIHLTVDDSPVDIGESRPLTLRHLSDLERIDPFNGLSTVSLQRLDLRQERAFLESTTFDSLTRWPAPDSMPPGFEPHARLQAGRDPGLGVRALHAEGIDGRGVAVAVIDQPLLREHVEYTDSLRHYDAGGLEAWEPQMHGSPIVGILVGRHLGIAPAARLDYWALKTTAESNRVFRDTVFEILDRNATLPPGDRVRVISISFGGFAHNPEPELWAEATTRADAEGVIVVTCARSFLAYGGLVRNLEAPADAFTSYGGESWGVDGSALLVPISNRTIASHRGPEVYGLETSGGLSWGAPYLAGLAALAFQVDPTITPARIRELLVSTVERTPVGPIVNPRGFIAAVRALRTGP